MRLRFLATLAVLACATPVAARADDARAIALVDQAGAPFRIADLRGRPAVLTFVATRCSDACPLANVAFAALRTRLAHDRVRARLVTITLDPAYDTPFVMSKLAQSFHADARDWVFASGSEKNVHSLMNSLGVVASTGKSGVPDVHTTFVYVLDRDARLSSELLLSSVIVKQCERALIERSKTVGTTNDRL
jgi:cytochrome oxidase Cu insertion factor (SCO1/SenC/PrrC family)